MEFVSYHRNNLTVWNILCAGVIALLRLNSRTGYAFGFEDYKVTCGTEKQTCGKMINLRLGRK